MSNNLNMLGVALQIRRVHNRLQGIAYMVVHQLDRLQLLLQEPGTIALITINQQAGNKRSNKIVDDALRLS